MCSALCQNLDSKKKLHRGWTKGFRGFQNVLNSPIPKQTRLTRSCHRGHVLDACFAYWPECPAAYDSSRPAQGLLDSGDVFIYLQMLCIVFFFFHSKLCTSLSIPSKMLDAKSPQGMCQRLLNTLCTLSLILHGFGFTVEEMQMAAHGIALWGNKGNTAYFSFFLLS